MKVITQGTWVVGAGDKAKTIESGKRTTPKALGISVEEAKRFIALGNLVRDAEEVAAEDEAALEKAQAELEKVAEATGDDLAKAQAEITALKDKAEATTAETAQLKKAAQGENAKLKAEVKTLTAELAAAKQGSL